MMNSSHLTDEQLQAFLLKEIQDEPIATHLAVCAACSKRLEEYRHLFHSMQQLQPEIFSFDVTELAMNAIHVQQKKKTKKQAVVFWGIMMVLFLVFSSFAIPYIPVLLGLFTSQPLFTTLLFTGTGFAVLLFLLTDILRQYSSKEEQLFKNKLQPKL